MVPSGITVSIGQPFNNAGGHSAGELKEGINKRRYGRAARQHE